MAEIVKTLKGHSGSEVYLMQQGKTYFVRKIGNVERNFERLTDLSMKNYPVVSILDYQGEILDIEYIQGLDIKNYLIANDTNSLTRFIKDILTRFSNTKADYKNYYDLYKKKLSWVKHNDFSFTIDQLIDMLPKELPQSDYFGDLTLDNILYSPDKGFILIDGITSEFDNYQFDIGKLNQDLICKWFLRNNNFNLDHKLFKIRSELEKHFDFSDPYITIFNLLRVYRYRINHTEDRKFLDKRIEELWK